MHGQVAVRSATAQDASFLAEMLAVAANWRPGVRPRSVEAVLTDPSFGHYVEGWPMEGDFGVVAEAPDPVGAAWWRFFRRDDPGFGYVDDAIPEISVGVVPNRRGRGVGRAMLDALIDEALRHQLRGICLSVEPDNPALRLYERVGFQVLERAGGAVTMVLRLDASGNMRR